MYQKNLKAALIIYRDSADFQKSLTLDPSLVKIRVLSKIRHGWLLPVHELHIDKFIVGSISFKPLDIWSMFVSLHDISHCWESHSDTMVVISVLAYEKIAGVALVINCSISGWKLQ